MHIDLRDIHKHYGAIHANRGISLSVEPGSVHGVLGENGAGKSTLMKILAGYTRRSSGSILLDHREVHYRTPAEATRLGIGMLYQDPLDFPPLSSLENFMVGLAAGGTLSPRERRRELDRLARRLGFPLHPDEPVEKLTVGERQQLELLRLLALGVDVLILDEPTTGISSAQKETLFRALRQLAREGRSVLLVSHKLEDVEALCDRITVLRRGTVAGTMQRPFDLRGLLGMMFDTPPGPPPRCEAEPGGPILSLIGVSATGGRSGLRDCSATLRRGEVVGLAGVEGSGQGVFLRVAAGLQRPKTGTVTFEGRALHRRGRRPPQPDRVRFLPAGRLEEGLIEGLTLCEHYALNWKKAPFLVPWGKASMDAEQGIRKYRIQGSPHTRVESLSGGNQQRLLLSLLPDNPTLLVLENPTRGLDLESARWVWQNLQSYCEKGTTIVFSSAELDEIMLVADRVLVFYDGAVVRDTAVAQTSAEELAQAIAGKVS